MKLVPPGPRIFALAACAMLGACASAVPPPTVPPVPAATYVATSDDTPVAFTVVRVDGAERHQTQFGVPFLQEGAPPVRVTDHGATYDASATNAVQDENGTSFHCIFDAAVPTSQGEGRPPRVSRIHVDTTLRLRPGEQARIGGSSGPSGEGLEVSAMLR